MPDKRRSSQERETPELLAFVREALTYEPESGELRWKERPREHFSTEKTRRSWNTQFAGKAAGSPDITGYLRFSISVGGRAMDLKCHRVAWALQTGGWPKDQIDHRDGSHANNRWTNLRESSQSENMQNRRSRRDSTSGLLGVTRDSGSKAPKQRPWKAQIQIDGHQRFLGFFATPEEAHARYLAAKPAVHPFQPVPRSMVEG